MKDKLKQLYWTDYNILVLLQNSTEFFPALYTAINTAKISIHLETYIFSLDKTGLTVLEHLEMAARRGVKVRVVLDGFGSESTEKIISQRLSLVGGQCRIYRPEPKYFRRFIPSRTRLRRLHRKLTVIDSKAAFIGGINITNDLNHQNNQKETIAPNLDFAVKIQGPLVSYLIYIQDWLWIGLSWKSLLRYHTTEWRHMCLLKPRYIVEKNIGTQRAGLVLRDNIRHRQTFERTYLYAIKHARSEILIANAYFFPSYQFINELSNSAARGVRVRLLLQGKIEYRMQYQATRSIYRQLFYSGVEIYEYMPSILHAKVAVIDNIGLVGSSNLDPFSLLFAREANVIVDDISFVQNLKNKLEIAIRDGGHLVKPFDYQRRGILKRFIDMFSYSILRFGVALTGKTDDY